MATENTSTTKFTIQAVFADETTSTFTVNDIDPESVTPQLISNARQTIMNFNANSGGELATKMKSKNGFNWIGIKSFSITTTNRTYIF